MSLRVSRPNSAEAALLKQDFLETPAYEVDDAEFVADTAVKFKSALAGAFCVAVERRQQGLYDRSTNTTAASAMWSTQCHAQVTRCLAHSALACLCFSRVKDVSDWPKIGHRSDVLPTFLPAVAPRFPNVDVCDGRWGVGCGRARVVHRLKSAHDNAGYCDVTVIVSRAGVAVLFANCVGRRRWWLDYIPELRRRAERHERGRHRGQGCHRHRVCVGHD